MLNCKQVSELISESLDRKLGFWTRMQMWMHLGMCGLCAKLRKTMVLLDQEVKQHSQEIEQNQDSSVKLPEDVRNRIKQVMKADG